MRVGEVGRAGLAAVPDGARMGGGKVGGGRWEVGGGRGDDGRSG